MNTPTKIKRVTGEEPLQVREAAVKVKTTSTSFSDTTMKVKLVEPFQPSHPFTNNKS
jgi:hypothetical protein